MISVHDLPYSWPFHTAVLRLDEFVSVIGFGSANGFQNLYMYLMYISYQVFEREGCCLMLVGFFPPFQSWIHDTPHSSDSLDPVVIQGLATSTFLGHTQCVTAVTWPGQQTIYSASWDHSVRQWDVQTVKETWNMVCTVSLYSKLCT